MNNSPIENQRPGYFLIAIVLCVVLVELLRTAWIGDDAAITLRTVTNLLAGHGANFNIDERVQAYTHPLWFALIALVTAVIGNVFTATFVLSITTSLAVMYVMLRYVVTRKAAALLVVAVLVLSRAWVDFSTSGLEAPMSHLLCLAVFLSGLRMLRLPVGRWQIPGEFFLLCSLLYLNRPDLLLLVAPFALLVCWSYRDRPRLLIKALAIGALPVLLWTLFSLFYYGFPFPNTAYAKLGNGIPRVELFYQGCLYFTDSFMRDPLTLACIALALLLAVRKGRIEQTLALGILLYLLWVMNIGGDFMSGRFLTAPLLFALVILVRAPLSQKNIVLLIVAALALGAINARATMLSGKNFSTEDLASDVSDERGYYFRQHSLLTGAFSIKEIGDERSVVACGGLGYRALESGMNVHVIDLCGLTDPLLARLPSRYDPRWRIGHFYRQLPIGYVASVEENNNLLADPVTRNYYASIALVTRGALFDPARLREIVRLNLQQVERPDINTYRYTLIPTSLGATADTHHNRDDMRFMKFGHYIDVFLPYPVSLQSIALWLNGSASYQLSYFSDGKYVAFANIDPWESSIDTFHYKGKLKITSPPVNKIRISAQGGVGYGMAGDLRINDEL